MKYGVQLSVSRESSDGEVVKAWRKVSLRAHPDKGGDAADFARLSAANDAWQKAAKQSGRKEEITTRQRVVWASAEQAAMAD